MKSLRRVSVFCLVAGIVLAASGVLSAAEVETPYIDGSMRKLGRGVANVFTAPGEIIRMTEIVGQRDGYLAGITVGMCQGFWRTILRESVGLFEVATFYAEIPRHFEPMLYPEFVFAHGSWGQQDK